MPIVLFSLCWQRPSKAGKTLPGLWTRQAAALWEQTGLKPASDGTRTIFSVALVPWAHCGDFGPVTPGAGGWHQAAIADAKMQRFAINTFSP